MSTEQAAPSETPEDRDTAATSAASAPADSEAFPGPTTANAPATATAQPSRTKKGKKEKKKGRWRRRIVVALLLLVAMAVGIRVAFQIIFPTVLRKVAGYYGLDRYILPALGTPWQTGALFRGHRGRPALQGKGVSARA